MTMPHYRPVDLKNSKCTSTEVAGDRAVCLLGSAEAAVGRERVESLSTLTPHSDRSATVLGEVLPLGG